MGFLCFCTSHDKEAARSFEEIGVLRKSNDPKTGTSGLKRPTEDDWYVDVDRARDERLARKTSLQNSQPEHGGRQASQVGVCGCCHMCANHSTAKIGPQAMHASHVMSACT